MPILADTGSHGESDQLAIDDAEQPAFYEVVTPRLPDLRAALAGRRAAEPDATSDDGALSPDLQWGQWANWASWTKLL
jgi:hypothetical protein